MTANQLVVVNPILVLKILESLVALSTGTWPQFFIKKDVFNLR